MDIGGWLRSLGLERYETTFRENEITEKGPAESDGGGPERFRRQPSSGTDVPCWTL